MSDFYILCKNVCNRAEFFLRKELRGIDLTPAQSSLLLFILKRVPKGTTLTELYREIGITKASLSSLIKSATEKGYLQAVTDNTDRRVKFLVPT